MYLEITSVSCNLIPESIITDREKIKLSDYDEWGGVETKFAGGGGAQKPVTPLII